MRETAHNVAVAVLPPSRLKGTFAAAGASAHDTLSPTESDSGVEGISAPTTVAHEGVRPRVASAAGVGLSR